MLLEEFIENIVKFVEQETDLDGEYNNASLRDIVILTIAAIYVYSLNATKEGEKC